MYKEIYLARHGQTNWNLEERFQGQVDQISFLTEQGEIEARDLGKLVSSIRFDKIYTSLLRRARDTANIVLSYLPSTPLECLTELNERHFGSLQGRTMHEVGIKNYATAGADLYTLESGILADAESLATVYGRVEKFRQRIISLPDRCILVIGHVSWNSYFINALLQEKIRFHPQKNGSFHYFKIDEGGKVLDHKLDTSWSEIPRSF